MKYTRPVALTATALMLAALTACGGAGKMPEDPYEALVWAAENYTSGNAQDVADAIPANEEAKESYVDSIGNGYVGEKSKCKVDRDSLNGVQSKVVSADVWCEEPMQKAQQLAGDPVVYFRLGEDGKPHDLKFADTFPAPY